jgi:hypothetical protein
MSERDAVAIREEIAAERQRLDDDLTSLERQLLSGAPMVAGVLVVVAAVVVLLLTRRKRGRGRPTSVTLTWKFR